MKSDVKDKVAYREQFVVTPMTTGASIGLRVFLSKDIAVDGSVLKGADPGIERSKYSVIADSAVVDFYSLEKKFIAYIPKNL